MFTQLMSYRRRGLSLTSRLAVTALLAGSVLAWTPDALANAYPDQPIGSVVPDCESGAPATVSIDAGTVTNITTLDLSADGGTAIGDSSGGDDNVAVTGGDKEKDKKGGKNNHKDNKHKDNDKRDRDDASELAASGNGGLSDASGNGGAIAVENVNSGGNAGSAIGVGDTWGGGYDACGNAVGGVYIDGGEVINETIISVSADGGTAIADASGGDGNFASTGGRAGNAIGVGDTIAGPIPICCEPTPYKPVPGKPVPAPAPEPSKAPSGKVVIVTMLPSTGVGMMTNGATAAVLAAVAAGMASIVARRRNGGDRLTRVGVMSDVTWERAAG
jgi:hypothetical protein